MAFRINHAVIRGEISNEVPGIVTGKIWLVGRADPIVLRLQGNCLRDLAGCAITFSNPTPQHQDIGGLSGLQKGTAGEMTASRKARIPMVPDDTLHQLIGSDQPVPHRWANCLYLEWFSAANGRVVIEAEGFTFTTSDRGWELPPADSGAPPTPGKGEISDPLDFFEEGELSEETIAEIEEEFGEPELDEEPLNEFEWEQELRDADARVDRYQEALKQYEDHVDRERLLEQAMGWEAEAETDESTEAPPFLEVGGAGEEFESDDEDDLCGHHYLTERVMDLALLVQKSAEMNGLIPEPSEDGTFPATPPLMVVNGTIMLGGKLAAGLDGLANGADPEAGYVIAMLKRALVPLNEALDGCAQSLETHRHDLPNYLWLRDARDELFDVRTEMLDLMEELRDHQ